MAGKKTNVARTEKTSRSRGERSMRAGARRAHEATIRNLTFIVNQMGSHCGVLSRAVS